MAIIAVPTIMPTRVLPVITGRRRGGSIKVERRAAAAAAAPYATDTSCGWLSAKPARDIFTNSALACICGIFRAPQ